MLERWFQEAGAVAWGTVHYRGLVPFMDEQSRLLAEKLCPNPGGVYVAAFPYYAGDGEGNLSLYARGEDYHRAVVRRLEVVCVRLRAAHPDRVFVPGADNSPIPEKAAASLAGLGLRGLHSLMILPPYGSYVFLGTVLTDLVLPTSGESAPDCVRCGKCVQVCPGGAISEAGVDRERCVSHMTQKKGALSDWEAGLVRENPCLWGCDLCQRVCPYNEDLPLTPLAEFRKDLILELSEDDLAGLTNRAFQEKYGDRAFAWRGPAVLRRNLALRRGQKEETGEG